MIGYLKGKIKDRIDSTIILEVNNVGYLVHFLKKTKIGDELELYIYHHVREDTSALYGFISKNELNLFKLLLSVSGVGPKMALNIANEIPLHDLKSAIEKNNAEIFKSISGVGKKIAAKIVIELKSKISKEDIDLSALDNGSELVDSLQSIGYKKSEIYPIIKDLPSDLVDISSQIKWVLKRSGSKFDSKTVK